jgi:carbonic anhydrase
MRHPIDLSPESPIGFFHALLLLAAPLLVGALLVLAPSQPSLASSAGNPHSIQSAIADLQEGNARFVAGRPDRPHRDLPLVARLARDGQTPLAAILTCADSRAVIEEVFDQGFGDLFVVRAAGAVTGVDQVGSLEYAVAHLGVPVVLVLSHTQCGAVQAALGDSQETGSLAQLLRKLSPVAMAVESLEGARRLDTAVALSAAVFREQLPLLSPVIDQAVKSGHLAVISGVLDTATGAVRLDLGAYGPPPSAAGGGHPAPAAHGADPAPAAHDADPAPTTWPPSTTE